MLLSEWEGMLDLWIKILDIMDRLMNSGQGDNLEEAVPESLKNILLVMVDGGFLTPPGPEDPPSELWNETARRVDRFLPGLITELFPNAILPHRGGKPPGENRSTPASPTDKAPKEHSNALDSAYPPIEPAPKEVAAVGTLSNAA